MGRRVFTAILPGVSLPPYLSTMRTLLILIIIDFEPLNRGPKYWARLITRVDLQPVKYGRHHHSDITTSQIEERTH